jgi:catalase
MREVEAGWTAFNPFDLTKIWPHAEFRLIEISMLELNHNAENYLTEVE